MLPRERILETLLELSHRSSGRSRPVLLEKVLRNALLLGECEGATLLAGGRRRPDLGPLFYEPTILTGVDKGMRLHAEETFGPVVAVYPVANEDDAIRLANDSQFGLGAALWTRDHARAERLAAEIEAGAVFVNGLVKSDPRLPFGGIKKSGYGRELSEYGIREFVNIKSVWMA